MNQPERPGLSGLTVVVGAIAVVIVAFWLLGMVLSAIGFVVKAALTVGVIIILWGLLRAAMGDGRSRR